MPRLCDAHTAQVSLLDLSHARGCTLPDSCCLRPRASCGLAKHRKASHCARSPVLKDHRVPGNARCRRRHDLLRHPWTHTTAHDRRARALTRPARTRCAARARGVDPKRDGDQSRDRRTTTRHLRPHTRLRVFSRWANGERRDGENRLRHCAGLSTQRPLRRTDSGRGRRCAQGQTRVMGDRLLRMLTAGLPCGPLRWTPPPKPPYESSIRKELTQAGPLDVPATQHSDSRSRH